MEDIIHLYPKTSCSCVQYGEKYNIPEGLKTNLSVSGCSISPYFDHHDRVELSSTRPQDKEGISELNPGVYSNKVAPFFEKHSSGHYSSWDPRLYNAAHESYITLDRPPMDGDVKLKNVYTLNSHNTGFIPYENLEDGQITYYVDKSIQDAFFTPVFSGNFTQKNSLYKDPMGSIKPEYHFIPEKQSHCLSFTQDTQNHRHDIMSLQMRKRNQERWMPRWAN
jgi:hypothetical protein